MQKTLTDENKRLCWDAIDTVLLDMDGTLLDLSFDNQFWNQTVPQHFAKLNQLKPADAEAHLAPIFAAEVGKLNWYCIDFWSDVLGFKVAELKEAHADKVRWRPHAESFLRRLTDSQREVLLITNAHPETLRIKQSRVNLAPWFKHMLTSHELGSAKESQAFWDALNSAHPFDPERTLFVDDSEHVLDAANAYGIQFLLTLQQPDSTRPIREQTRYPSVLHFNEIFEGLPGVD